MYYHTYTGRTKIILIASPTISGIMGHGKIQEKTLFTGSSRNLTQLWASSLTLYQDHWYLFFPASTDNIDRNHRIYILKSRTRDPMGQWDFMGQLVLPPFDQKAIGPRLYVINDRLIFGFTGNVSLDYSEDRDKSEQLYLVELQEDSAKGFIVKSKDRTMISEPTYSWEKQGLPHNEGVFLMRSPLGTLYCIYSCSWAGSDHYKLGMLKLNGNDPFNASAWEKFPEPVFQSSPLNNVYAPGNPGFTKSPDGTEDWILFTNNSRQGVPWNRDVSAQKFEWVDDRPVFGVPESRNTALPLPSGEVVDRIMIQAEDMIIANGAKIVEIYDDKLVDFPDKKDTASAVVSVPEKSNYALYIRFRNNTAEISEIYVRLNEGKQYPVSAGRSDKYCSITAVGLPLEAGKNLLTFSTARGLKIDLIILDRIPVK